MGATNSTLHYQLSQFISTDKPAWLQDYNGDMQKIDNGINGALVAAESAQNSADTANTGVGTVSDAVSALQTTVAGHTSDITDLSGDVNTIESLIGNGTPTAGDHTIIGACNANTNAIASVVHQPNYNDVIRALNAPGINYTMAADGWIIGAIQSVAGGNAPMIQVNGVIVAYAYANPNSTVVACGVCVPVKAGDVVTTSGASGTTFNVNILGVN